MYFRSVQMSKVKVSARPSSEYEAFLPFVPDFVKQPESVDLLLTLVCFPDTALQNRQFVDLTVVTPDLR